MTAALNTVVMTFTAEFRSVVPFDCRKLTVVLLMVSQSILISEATFPKKSSRLLISAIHS